jgi:hypothetical protein
MKTHYVFNALLALTIGGTAAVWDAVQSEDQIVHWLNQAMKDGRTSPRSPQGPVLLASNKTTEALPAPRPVGFSRAMGQRPAVGEASAVVERPAGVERTVVGESAGVVERASHPELDGSGNFDNGLLQPALGPTSLLALAGTGNRDRRSGSQPVTGAAVPADFTIPIPEIQFQKKASARRNRVSLGYSMGFNITADFKHVGSYPAAGGGPGTATSATDHNYDNGYSRVDITGNDHGGFKGTWNWGYRDASQISGDKLVMQSSSLAGGAASNDNSPGPQPGFELTYGRELGHAEHWHWGMEGAFGFTEVTIRDSRPLTGSVNVTRDAYALNGIIPPVAPYQGTYNGPGAIISDLPDRTVTTLATGATITGSRELDANLFAFKVGPYVEVPLTESWALNFRGGLAVVAVNSEFTYQETTTISGVGTSTSSGQGSQSDLLVGVYAGGSVSCALSDHFGAFAGAQYQNVGEYVHNLNGRKAVLDLSKSIFVTIGLSYSY